MNDKTAIVIGATGLVGSEVLNLLLEDERYSKVHVFHRRTTGQSHPKLEEHIVNFSQIDEWKHLIKGDELYSALGTTIKKAGGQERQYTIDYTYQYETAKAAAGNGAQKFALVSSLGANPESRAFYPRLKGELDEAVQELPFEVISILRPSILEGNRQESRPLEQLGILFTKVITKFPGLSNYRPIPAKTVARALIYSLNKCTPGTHIFEGEDIFHLS
ncbi:NAD(P)H-binding protein [Gracilimonas mengyeensis]|uniref:NAD(P)H-binding n=1 Tax=Gracilimonas mengyeensis TaxID=1302730 RepID=A0A521ELQ4_9BACT|nr:NAD(P)H-binding protein [Gracilimonas mengyeensis]SMO84832.1 NAD(P)H-binding [Gracilimonas mengyeensis]